MTIENKTKDCIGPQCDIMSSLVGSHIFLFLGYVIHFFGFLVKHIGSPIGSICE